MAAGFCFNFQISAGESEDHEDTLTKEHEKEEQDVEKCTWKPAEVVCPTGEEISTGLDSNFVTQFVHLPDPPHENRTDVSCLRHLSVKHVENVLMESPKLSSCGTNKALEGYTDLIPSIYEGGMKIWECSLDLVEFLHQNHVHCKMANKKVLEIGCGAGLPGIYALLHGATVHFQDYNEEVLKLFTIPNVVLNLDSKNSSTELSEKNSLLESVQTRCMFISGDWSSAASLLQSAFYDIILTSETIYSVKTQHSLYQLMKLVLKPDGVAFIAAKSYYFGVGGGTEQFVEMVHKDGIFSVRTLSSYDNGVKREILKMEKKSK